MTDADSIRTRRSTQSRRPEPGIFTTDVAARWILARRGVDPSRITTASKLTNVSHHRWTIAPRHLRAPGTEPMDAAVRSGSAAAILLTAVWLGDRITIHSAIAHRGGLLPPQVIVLGVALPNTVLAAAAGRPLGQLLDHPELGALADAPITSVQTHRDQDGTTLQIRLQPGRIVHMCMIDPAPEKDDR